MTRYRYRAVLLLFLVLNLTACYTWQGIATTSPAAVIDATQPDRVRVVVRGEGEVELANPSVEGDQLVGTTTTRTGGSFEPSDDSISLEDILQLEIRKFSILRSVFAGLGIVYGIAGAVLLAECVSKSGCR